ncbi:MAG: hypothetical protein E7235_02415 [Lachnospiraceae bacterium]|nr:hypothetical protein [Lachnospiraceae bacterium]
MRFKDWDNYLDDTLKYVKFFFDRGEIRKELNEHMEDMYEDMLESGISEEDAIRLVVEYMGDADEIGRALNREHKPWIGWLWVATRFVAVMLFIMVIGEAASFGISAAGFLFDDNEYASDGELVYEMDINESFRLDDDTVTLEELKYYDNGDMVVKYKRTRDFGSDAVDWSFGLHAASFTDENGTQFLGGGGYSRGSVLGDVGFLTINDFPYESDMLILDYNYNGRLMYAEIPVYKAKEAVK